MPHRRCYATRSAILAVPLTVMVVGCASDTRVRRLEERVDSLVTTVAALVQARPDRAAPALTDTITVGTRGVAYLGDSAAPVTIVEFTDYQCPFSARHVRQTLPEIRAAFLDANLVRYVVRDLPLSAIHPLAVEAAQAARCAARAGPDVFWRYHDELFDRQPEISQELFTLLAEELDVDEAAFVACLNAPATRELVDRDLLEAQEAGLSGTPAFVIGVPDESGTVTGVVIRGAYPFEVFRAAIESALRVSGRRGPT